jgi:hypothetical protein
MWAGIAQSVLGLIRDVCRDSSVGTRTDTGYGLG